MNDKNNKLSRDEVRDYCRKNYDGVMGFLFNADQDYVAARCCILNGLYSGFMLASQAIERMLKAFIYLETKEKMTSEHNPYLLKEKLKKIKDYNFDNYDEILKKLSDHYKTRYHDNKMDYETNGSSTEEIVIIDKLWLDLKEKLPIPNEVKYRTKFFCDLCEPNIYYRDNFWLKKNNIAISEKFEFLKMKYDEVLLTLYPRINK